MIQVLEVVCAPVRVYLQSRDDTIRSIVTSLIDDDSNSELFSELADGMIMNLSYTRALSTCFCLWSVAIDSTLNLINSIFNLIVI